jgi:hypothetical protein
MHTRSAFALVIVILGCPLHAGNTPYEFPIRPNTPEWLLLSPPEAKVACQIPESIIHELDTDALLETCVRYPFLIDVLLLNGPGEGLEQVISQFNGFRALALRKDAARALLDWYRKNTDNLPGTSDPPFLKLIFLHQYLGRTDVMQKFDVSQKAQLALQSLRFVTAMRLRYGSEDALEAMGANLFVHLMTREGVVLITTRGQFDATSLPTDLADAASTEWQPPSQLCDLVQSVARQILP